MAGNAPLFAREDSVAEAWRLVDPVLKADTPVYVDEPGAWGPSGVDQKVSPAGSWPTSHVTGCGANGLLTRQEECEHANRG
jgi:glucose-6-phosphate 1-dehydrogenase